ncbi:RNA-binding domain superfamily [Arabidopsis thaliana x Arabidopsis arenosa]|uniref:peptidylprolyl isomerase n=1 Tax=Arabidopsis thaliana x Arabidopsis arenosa TaxID=1240361 RepID=A0A8T1YTV7_9BRAS|nr:RNA-binding domain superfamily [Arabidopsis thaliana x Arabidopsis arenosa]
MYSYTMVPKRNNIPKLSDVGRIKVTGYDTGLPLDDVYTALAEHFSSCGEIWEIYVPLKFDETKTSLNSHGVICLLGGQDAVEKALQLTGSNVGGWNVSVEAYPYPANANDRVIVRVEGYDTSLRKSQISRALVKLFSPYGTIRHLYFIKKSSVRASVHGKDVADTVTQLNGSYMRGRKLAVWVTAKPEIPIRLIRRRVNFSKPIPPLQDPSAMDAAIPKSRSESSMAPSESAKKKEKTSEEATVEYKAISTSVEKQTPDPDELNVDDLCMGNPNGKKAGPGKRVTVHYTGKLHENGKIFDSTVGKSPYKFRLGVGKVIKGLDVGVNGMYVGGKRKLTIPPAFGYGRYGAEVAGTKIPPDAWLVFDVELLNVR